ncbi:hypothetical protein Sros01_02810 [Streptomyces roseochromogenus]|nr:hypothetical protein Sros01_02810 [Streptomyces roseochromogenus]
MRVLSREVGRVRDCRLPAAVDVPVRTAYDQWTQFESFPQFMDGVARIEQSGLVTFRPIDASSAS